MRKVTLLIALLGLTASVQCQGVQEDQASNVTDTRQQQASNQTEPLSELLVKQSNLQAEESQQVASVISVLPPLAARPNDQRQSGPALAYRGGSGNTYMSITRDGSNRYEFGFDTAKAQPQTDLPKDQAKRPRLMREESRLEDGTVIGRYGYTDPFNVFRIVQYVAGPDGYFASEDVGALDDNNSSAAGGKPKFQLNKQLHKALEQARAQRLRASRQTSARSEQKAPARTEPEVARHRAHSNNKEALSSSASYNHEVRYSTKINHVTGVNGASYATAFRPVIVPSSKLNYEPVRVVQQEQHHHQPPQPNPSDLLQRQHLQWEQQRSKLPAPIYKPTMLNSPYGLSSSIQHEQQVQNDNWLTNQQQQQEQQRSQIVVQSTPIAQHNTLESSPAWNLLNNNYQTTSLIIDHQSAIAPTTTHIHRSQPAPVSIPTGQFKKIIEQNFEREATILKSLQAEKANFKSPNTQNMAYNYQQQPTNYSPIRVEFGARTAMPPHDNSYDVQQISGLALKQFNPPLYSPEVHETRAIQESPTTNQEAQPVVYSSTIIHSEVAAERDYRPQRMSYVNDLQRSSSEEALSKRDLPNTRGEALILDAKAHQKPIESEIELTNKTTPAPSQINRQQQGFVEQPIVRYATRLTSLANQRRQDSDDLDIMAGADSELVITNSTTNGTLVSRARLPDRSKKLSSIFRARQQTLSGGANGEADGGRIRRPVPVNVRKQYSQPQQQQPNSSTTIEYITPSEPTLNAEPILVTKEELAKPLSGRPSSPTFGNKKFGKSNFQGPTESLELPPQDSAAVPAKKRPLLREPKRQVVIEEVLPALASTTTTTTTTERPNIEQTSSTIASVDLPKVTGFNNDVPTATIIDVMNSTGSPVDKELFEKIAKIQRELTAMNSTASIATTTKTPEPSSTSSTVLEQLIPLITTTTTEKPIQIRFPEPTTPLPRVEKPTMNSQPIFARQSEVTMEVSNMNRESSNFNNDQNNLMTGPLMTMDMSMDQGDFLAKLTQDMDAFDSVRGTTTTRDLKQSTSPTTTTSTTTTTTESPSTAAPTTAPALVNQSIASVIITVPPEVRANNNSADTQTQAPGIQVNSSSVLSSPALNLTELVQPATTKSPTTTTSRPETTPIPTSTTTAPTAATAATTTTTSTSTSTTEKPRFKSLRSTSAQNSSQARFGRLVIKRGDKVVARFNGSEPIPDSLIPIGNNVGSNSDSGIIVPDMPRLGMRRAVKRKQMSTTTTTTTTASPSISIENKTNTTAAPALLEPNKSDNVIKLVASSELGVLINADNGTAPNITKPLSENRTDTMQLEESASQWVGVRMRSKRKGLWREPRSSSSLVIDDDELMFSESETNQQKVKASTVSPNVTTGNSPVASTTRAAAAATVSPTRRNWSSRVSLNRTALLVPPKPKTDKKYDAKEDLEKMVEKISTIERSKLQSETRRARVEPTSARLTIQTNQPRKWRKSVSLNNSTSSTTTAPPLSTSILSDIERVPTRSNASLLMQKKENVTMQLNNTVILDAARQPVASNTNDKSAPLMVAKSLETKSNATTSTTAASTTTESIPELMMNKNVSVTLEPKNITLVVPINSTTSSSIAFNVTMSPEKLDKHWEQMKPVNSSAKVGTTSPDKVRMDSHGHIHVRNNQSLTVHVDIEPPNKPLTVQSTVQQQKRLVNRDTLQVAKEMNQMAFGRDDIRRIGIRPLNRNSIERQQAIDVNAYPSISGEPMKMEASSMRLETAGPKAAVEIVSASSQETLPKATPKTQKRKPKLLCIEVDQSDPLDQMQRVTRQQ